MDKTNKIDNKHFENRFKRIFCIHNFGAQDFVNIGSVMEDYFNNNPINHSPDLERFIRSIQYIEGNPDCFGKAEGHCDREDCLWHEYCLKK